MVNAGGEAGLERRPFAPRLSFYHFSSRDDTDAVMGLSVVSGVNTHLIVDARATSFPLGGKAWLNSMVERANMKVLDGPHVAEAKDGVTGFVVIEESHISFHYFNSGRLHVDVFSCKEFDTTKMARKIKQDWGCADLQFHSRVINRRVF